MEKMKFNEKYWAIILSVFVGYETCLIVTVHPWRGIH